MSNPSRIVKSLFWLTTCSSLGYVLLLASSQSDDEYKKIGEHFPGVDKKSKETLSKNQQFMNVLQSAAESDKPLYRLDKKEFEKTIDK